MVFSYIPRSKQAEDQPTMTTSLTGLLELGQVHQGFEDHQRCILTDIREAIHLDHTSLDNAQETVIFQASSEYYNTNILIPCTKKEPTQALLQKGKNTVHSLAKVNSPSAYTDGSSDIDSDRGGAGIYIDNPSENKLKILTGQISSNFTSELIAIKEALTHCLRGL